MDFDENLEGIDECVIKAYTNVRGLCAQRFVSNKMEQLCLMLKVPHHA